MGHLTGKSKDHQIIYNDTELPPLLSSSEYYFKSLTRGRLQPCLITFDATGPFICLASMVNEHPEEDEHRQKQKNPTRMTVYSKNKQFKEDFVYLKIIVGDRDIKISMQTSFKEPRQKSAIPFA